VTVHVARHAVFSRRGRDITLVAPITFPQAALGTTISVPTLDAPVSLKVPPGTPTGRTFRVRGRGVPSGNGTQGPGDLLVTVEVAVPRQMTDEQRKATEQLAATLGQDQRAAEGR
jgi:molecular chaperone DnaJ